MNVLSIRAMATRQPLTLLLLFVLAPAVTDAALAQSGAVQQRLAKATSLSCAFTVMTTSTWKEGVPGAQVKPATIKVTFTNVNVDEGTADAGNNFGGAYIVVRYANDYLHLMQSHSSGALYATSVFARETQDGRLMAVHTRHEYTDVSLPGFTSRPEMYLGDCAIGT